MYNSTIIMYRNNMIINLLTQFKTSNIHHTINEYINLGFFRLEIQHTFTINEYINSVFIKGLIFYYCYSNDIFQMLILIFSVQRVSFVGVYPRSFA